MTKLGYTISVMVALCNVKSSCGEATTGDSVWTQCAGAGDATVVACMCAATVGLQTAMACSTVSCMVNYVG